MTIWNLFSTEKDTDVANEEILNVLRRNEDLVMGTTSIAESIGMSRQGAQNRLEKLEEAGRVKTQMVGRTLVWGLHPDERQQPVPPEIDRLVLVLERIRRLLAPTKFIGGVITIIGLLLIYFGLTGSLFSITFPTVRNSTIIGLGWVLVGVGGGMLLIGGSVVYGTHVTERFAHWRISQRRLQNHDRSSGITDQRGQFDPRLLAGLFVLILVAGPIIREGMQLQAGLAESPAFSPLLAAVVAFLFVLAIVLAILGR